MCGHGEKSADFGCAKCVESILDRRHGWIECKSTSFPGKVYYFHTATRCSTWQRPVPRNTQLPRYKKCLNSKSAAFTPMGDQNFSTRSNVSDSENLITASEVPPSNLELYVRRMQIYLEKNSHFSLAMEYGRGESLRDKLIKCYKNARSEFEKKLMKNKARKKSAEPVATTVKEKTRRPNPVKIIRECHGIKTISYDPVPIELPNNVKMPDLSETSVDSYETKRSRILYKNVSPSCQKNLVFKDLNLSESGTSVLTDDV